MPKYQNVNVTCPDCGKTFKVKQFTRIDPVTMPKQRRAVENSELFQETCPYCHKDHEYPYSFSWRESRSHMDIVFAANAEDKEEFLREYEGEEDVRIVDNHDDFMEKVMIFRNGLDDRIVEVGKLVCLDAMQENDPEVKSVRFSDDTMYGPAFCGMDGEMTRVLLQATDIYQKLDAALSTRIENDEQETPITDHAWAEAFYNKNRLDELTVGDLVNDAEVEEEDTHVYSFFEAVEKLEYSDHERDAAQLIIQDFDRIWDDILKENPGKPKLSELDDKYGEVVNAVGDFSMILMNEKKYQECMNILKRINDTTDLSDDYLMYMNNRRDYMECLGHVKGFDAKVKYLDDWMKEMPDNPYLYGTKIDVWLWKDPQKALELAKKYVNTPINNIDDSWLLDSCENVVRETGDPELKKQLEAAEKKYRNFGY